MSGHHSEAVSLKPIGKVAKFLKNLIPVNIPKSYVLKPMFKDVAGDEDIRKGILAFRDCLHLICDILISEGHLYAKPPKKPKSIDDYPFLHYLTNLLVDIGYHGELTESGDALLLMDIPIFSSSIDEKGKITKSKVPVSNQMECLRFLNHCGFVLGGVDMNAKKLEISKEYPLEVSYPSNPLLLTGLRAISIADMELRETRRYWNDNNLLRCDYRLLKAEDTDMRDVLKDILHPLPENLQEFAYKLHLHHVNMGMTCAISIRGDVHFGYAHIKKNRQGLSAQDVYSRRVWGFSISLKHGYCIVVRAKQTAKYADVIENFPLSLREVIAKGYGCDRKLHGEKCQGGCQGIRILLDDSVLDISEDIKTWLDIEAGF